MSKKNKQEKLHAAMARAAAKAESTTESTSTEQVAESTEVTTVAETATATESTSAEPTVAKKAEKVAKVKTPTIRSVCIELIMAGKSNTEIWAVIQPQFSMPDNHKHYPGWYRNELKRKGTENVPASVAPARVVKAKAKAEKVEAAPVVATPPTIRKAEQVEQAAEPVSA